MSSRSACSRARAGASDTGGIVGAGVGVSGTGEDDGDGAGVAVVSGVGELSANGVRIAATLRAVSGVAVGRGDAVTAGWRASRSSGCREFLATDSTSRTQPYRIAAARSKKSIVATGENFHLYLMKEGFVSFMENSLHGLHCDIRLNDI